MSCSNSDVKKNEIGQLYCTKCGCVGGTATVNHYFQSKCTVLLENGLYVMRDASAPYVPYISSQKTFDQKLLFLQPIMSDSDTIDIIQSQIDPLIDRKKVEDVFYNLKNKDLVDTIIYFKTSQCAAAARANGH